LDAAADHVRRERLVSAESGSRYRGWEARSAGEH